MLETWTRRSISACATGAATALISTLNKVDHEKETRGFIKVNLLALAFTLAGGCFVVLSLAAIGAAPPIVEHCPSAPFWRRWCALCAG